MSKFDQLTDLVDSGEISLIHVEAVPRSVSTALSRALNESDTPSIFVNEPFNRRRYDIDTVSGKVLEAVRPALKGVDQPLTVITKNMARNLTALHHAEWAELSRAVVWAVRDPVVQIGSLVTRIANDLTFEPGAAKITLTNLTDDHIQLASDYLERSTNSTDFSKTSWAAIGEHFSAGLHHETGAVVDGADLTSRPFEVLCHLAATTTLLFTQRMVDGWSNTFTNANGGYSATLADEEYAWTAEAVKSTSIKPVSHDAIDVDRLPPSLRSHLDEVARPVYSMMTGSALYVDPKSDLL